MFGKEIYEVQYCVCAICLHKNCVKIYKWTDYDEKRLSELNQCTLIFDGKICVFNLFSKVKKFDKIVKLTVVS